jgi:hypothetical protein
MSLKLKIIRKVILQLLHRYVKFFPMSDVNRFVICPFAKGCHRSCPCNEKGRFAKMYKMIKDGK